MSAVEKLKALEAQSWTMLNGERVPLRGMEQNGELLADILPQIVAVVEADEAMLSYLEAFLQHEHKQPFLTLRSLVRDQRAALVALDETLT